MGNGCCSRQEKPTAIVPPTIGASNCQIESGYLSLPNRFAHRQDREELVGLAGLDNVGNTCFVNAGLQCVLNCQPLVDYFLSEAWSAELNAVNPKGSKGMFTRAFVELVKAQWTEVYDQIVPKHLVELAQARTPIFAENTQNDVQELLIMLLDVLHEDLNRAQDASPITPLAYTDESDEKQAARAWAMHLRHDSSVIVDLFQGQFKSSVTCSRCKHRSVTFDTFMYISLPVPKSRTMPSLQDCLEEFTKEETLEQGWVCPKCRIPVVARKKFDIWKVPPVLLFHLKRFLYTQTQKGKINKPVIYPVADLDLRRYVTGPQKVPPIYDLFAKADHEGTLGSGHYTATCKNSNLQTWHRFDDGQVSPENEGCLVSSTAYVLFYCKNSVTEYQRQAENLPQFWPHVFGKEGGFGSEDLKQTFESESVSSQSS